jgi:hypothetical protein
VYSEGRVGRTNTLCGHIATATDSVTVCLHRAFLAAGYLYILVIGLHSWGTACMVTALFVRII